MKNLNLFFAFILVSGSVFSQEWVPVLTEQWEPVPKIITPGNGSAPPSDAIVLFDGSSMDQWENPDGGPAGWEVKDGIITVVKGNGEIQTKKGFGDVQLHIEWRTPAEVVGEGQGRGNSGVFLQQRYEVQVLDNYENITYPNGQAGSVYKQHIPLVNACLPPGEWQTYDIIYTAPRFNENGTLFSPAKLTVLHNGVLIQNHISIKGPSEYIGQPPYEAHDIKQSLMLQEHSNPVSYRNIWLREL
ncbi:MAG TPA: DUF1080 domain-containing protein [Bacteroides sp.]|nr:DUF1080 domain-containing protein [Bacteroides sp.]